MSHFDLLLMIDPEYSGHDPFSMKQHIRQRLEKYNCGTQCKEFLEFVEIDRSEEYKNGSVEFIRYPNNNLSPLFDHKEDAEKGTIIQIPYRILFPTIEDFHKNWCVDDYDSNANSWGHYENPNGKFDSFVVGGRYKGYLTSKQGYYCSLLGLITQVIPENESYYKLDLALVKDCKFSPKKKYYNQAISYWEHEVEGQEIEYTDLDWLGDKEKLLRRYETKEKFADCYASFHTFAVLDLDGNWHQKANMFSFGISDETDEQEIEWDLGFYDRFIKPIDTNTLLAIIDCHI